MRSLTADRRFWPSRHSWRGSGIAAALLALPLAATSAQSTVPRRSTQAGVYTAEQAARGQDTYATLCTGCHTAATHTGVAFEHWDGHSLSELFAYISTRMPKNEPGSLAPEQYADVLAYMLKLNQMPTGTNELPTDTTVLAAIRIDTKPTTAKRGSR
jgi:mono/diheme cytochrome c family protein